MKSVDVADSEDSAQGTNLRVKSVSAFQYPSFTEYDLSSITQGVDDEVYMTDCATPQDSTDKVVARWVEDPVWPAFVGVGGVGIQIARYDANSMWLRQSNNGQIRKWRPSTSTWGPALLINGVRACASDIAAGPNGLLFTLGCETSADKSIWAWNGSTWMSIAGAGKRINVTDDGNIFLLTSPSHPQPNKTWLLSFFGWQALPGTWKQIASGPGANFTALGLDNRIYFWNGTSWFKSIEPTPRSATKSFVGDGRWATNSESYVFRRSSPQ